MLKVNSFGKTNRKMAGLLLCAVFLWLVGADTPCWCANDQVLGTWKVESTSFKYTVKNDRTDCPENLRTKETRMITLLSPNVAVDEDTGASGTWSQVYSQAIQINIGGVKYLYFLAWEEVPDSSTVHSMCYKSQPGMGWAVKQGMTRRYRACIRATNVKPLLSTTDNYYEPSGPGPVNPTLIRRKLDKPVPTGDMYVQMKKNGDIVNPPTGFRQSFSHSLFSTSAGTENSNSSYRGDKLPSNFDWRSVNGKSYVPEPFDQGHCGSCYTAATVWAMTARVMVASEDEDKIGVTRRLSVQHALDCNQYAQGCSGGFAEMVVKFAEEFGILTENGYYISYLSGDGVDRPCNAGKFLEGDRYFFTAGLPLGGYTGAVTDPEEIKWEIYRHGPLPVSVYAGNDLFRNCSPYGPSSAAAYANSGDDGSADDKAKRHYFAEYLDHLIFITGWEEDENGVAYWRIQNSWGADWCDGGTSRIALGRNEYGIETAPVPFYWWRNGRVYYDEGLVTVSLAEVIVLPIIIVILVGLIIGLSFVIAIIKKRKHLRYQKLRDEQTTHYEFTSTAMDSTVPDSATDPSSYQ